MLFSHNPSEGFDALSASYTGTPIPCEHPRTVTIELYGYYLPQCTSCGFIAGLTRRVTDGIGDDEAPEPNDYPQDDIEAPDREC